MQHLVARIRVYSREPCGKAPTCLSSLKDPSWSGVLETNTHNLPVDSSVDVGASAILEVATVDLQGRQAGLASSCVGGYRLR